MAMNGPASVKGKSIQFYGATGGAGIWQTDAGLLFTNAEATELYNPAYTASGLYLKVDNKTRTAASIYCDNDTSDGMLLSITGVFPSVPHYPSQFRFKKDGVQVSEAKDGTRSGRVTGNNKVRHHLSLMFRRRLSNEIVEVRDFYEWHYPHLPFYYSDRLLKLTDRLFWFDAEVQGENSSHIAGDFDLVIMEKANQV